MKTQNNTNSPDLKKNEFLELLKLYFPNEFEQIISGYTKQKNKTFRINTLSQNKNILENLKKQGFELEYTEISNVYKVLSEPFQISKTNEFKNGEIYIQSVSGLKPVLKLNPKPNEKVLDMCASPGSKTTYISELTQNSGEIIALDNNYKRKILLDKQIEKYNCKNVVTLCLNSANLLRIKPMYAGYFDRVLLDAPCSNEGSINPFNKDEIIKWHKKAHKGLQKLQKKLLACAISCTKPKGVVVYSTCTFMKEENQEVIDWALKKFENISLLETNTITPQQPDDGFFIAVLQTK